MLDIKNYEGLYAISSTGKVWSYPKYNGVGFREGKWLKTFIHRGYEYVTLTKDSVQKKYLIHRLVAQSFLENNLLKKEVNHINGIKHDNRVENLEWVSPKENSVHAYKTGLHVHIGLKGEKNPKSKLRVKDILYIRGHEIVSSSDRKYFMKRFGVKKNTISDIINRKSWTHV